jgi:rare lipoprotein A (peptidoglycan hydrolase)
VPYPGGGTQVLHAGLVATYPGARPQTRRWALLCTVVAAVLVIVLATYSDLAADAPTQGDGWAYAASGEIGSGTLTASSGREASMMDGASAGRRPRDLTEAVLTVASPADQSERPLSAPLGGTTLRPQVPWAAPPQPGAAVSGRVARPVARPAASRGAAVGAGATVSGGWHVAYVSWYGPGFYGNRTACGLAYTREIVGVAHRTLPCGTRVMFRNGSRVVTTTVIDRGPYVAGRNWDLSAGLCTALAHCYTGNIEWRFP